MKGVGGWRARETGARAQYEGRWREPNWSSKRSNGRAITRGRRNGEISSGGVGSECGRSASYR